MAVRLSQPPADPKRPVDQTAWLEQVGRIINAMVSSGTTADRPTAFMYPGRTYYDTDLDIAIWRNAGNTDWVDATGAPV